MDKLELLDLIGRGESSFTEFKSDDKNVSSEALAEYVVSFANAKGGRILIGVEDSGAVSGLRGRFAEYGKWVADSVQGWVHPNIIVDFEEVPLSAGKKVAVIHVPVGVAKPYCLRKGKEAKERYFIRDATTCRETDREELRRLFQSSGLLHYEVTPIPRSRPSDLSFALVANYFKAVRGIDFSVEDKSQWQVADGDWLQLMVDNQLLTQDTGEAACTLAGILLFGRKDRVKMLLPQAGISAVEYDDPEAEIEGRYRKDIAGPLLSLRGDGGETLELGIIDEAVDFVIRVRSHEEIQGTERKIIYDYPPDVLREAIVNAVAHRDYTIGGTNIGLWLYPDRLEIDSPGDLPNTITIQRMLGGARYHRNQMLVDYLRDMGYMEGSGRGVSKKIVRGMLAHNGKEPRYELRGESLRLTLFA